MRGQRTFRSRFFKTTAAALLAALTITLSCGAAHANTWMTRVSDINIGYHNGGIIETSDLGYALAGTYRDAEGTPFAGIAKFGAGGNLEWSKQYVAGRAVDIDDYVGEEDGPGMLLVAEENMTGRRWVATLNEDGTIRRQTYIESSGSYAVAEGNIAYLVQGGLEIIRFNLDTFAVEWSKAITYDIGNLRVRSIEIRNGNPVITGWVTPVSDIDTFVMEVSTFGDLVAFQVIGRPGLNDKARDLTVLDDGSIILGGDGANATTGGNYDVWVVKVNPDWTIGWQKMFERDGTDWCNTISRLNDNTIAVGATSRGFSSNGEYDFWGIRIKDKAAGPVVKWQKRYWTPERDETYAQVSTSDGGVVLAADHTDFTYDRGSSLVKMDVKGNVYATDATGAVINCPCRDRTDAVVIDTTAVIASDISNVVITDAVALLSTEPPVADAPLTIVEGGICSSN